MTEVRVVSHEVTAPLRQVVLRPWLSVADVLATDDEGANVAVLDGDHVLACASVRQEGFPDDPQPGDWRLRGMASDPEVRGAGHGSAALAAAVTYAIEQGATRLWCSARSGAVGFYEKHGWATYGDEYDVEPIGPHYLMLWSTSGST